MHHVVGSSLILAGTFLPFCRSRLYRRASLLVMSTPARCSRTHHRTSHAGSSCIVLQQYEERFSPTPSRKQMRSMMATNSDLQVQLAN
ncbi:hypothetical protein EDB89DRAFT_2021359, partial [Lactarius sanguifluus]